MVSYDDVNHHNYNKRVLDSVYRDYEMVVHHLKSWLPFYLGISKLVCWFTIEILIY